MGLLYFRFVKKPLVQRLGGRMSEPVAHINEWR